MVMLPIHISLQRVHLLNLQNEHAYISIIPHRNNWNGFVFEALEVAVSISGKRFNLVRRNWDKLSWRIETILSTGSFFEIVLIVLRDFLYLGQGNAQSTIRFCVLVLVAKLKMNPGYLSSLIQVEISQKLIAQLKARCGSSSQLGLLKVPFAIFVKSQKCGCLNFSFFPPSQRAHCYSNVLA